MGVFLLDGLVYGVYLFIFAKYVLFFELVEFCSSVVDIPSPIIAGL